MIITVSLDKNVTFNETFDFLENTGIFSTPDIKAIFEKDRTLYLDIEIINSTLCKQYLSLDKNNIYVNMISDIGMTIFTISDPESENTLFIPISNIAAIRSVLL